MSKAVWIIVATLLVFAARMAFDRAGEPPVGLTGVAAENKTAARPHVPEASRAVVLRLATPAASATSPSPAPSLSGSMLNARDLRAFAMSALAQPGQGGVAYAMYARALCARQSVLLTRHGLGGAVDPPYVAPEDPRLYEARVQMLKLATTACASYTSDELDAGERKRLTRLAASTGDRYYELSGRSIEAIRADDGVARSRLLGAALADRDPLLLSIVLPKLIDASAIGALVDDPAPASAGEREAVADAALTVLPCKFGLVCDARSADVLDACLTSAKCLPGRIDVARDRLPASSRPAFDAALARLESAVRAGRVDLLLPS